MQKAKNLSLLIILALLLSIPNAYAIKNGEKFKDWQGQCDTVRDKQICGISQTIKDSKNDKPLANIFIRKIKEKEYPFAFIKVPLMVDLLAGLGVAVDGKQVTQVPYTLCDPAGCNTVIELKEDILTKMKKGRKLQIAMSYLHKEVVLTASLSGISKALSKLK